MTLPAFRTPVNYSGSYDATSLIAYFSQPSKSIAVCGAFTPVGGSTIGVTTNSSDLSNLTGYSGVVFKSLNGVNPSKSQNVNGVGSANMESTLLITSTGITEADVVAGKWRNATVCVFLVNFEAPAMGQVIINKGKLADFTQAGEIWKTSIHGWNNALNANILRVTRFSCDADLGDARCKLDLSGLGFIKTGTLTGVTSQTVITDSGRAEAGDYFDNGKFAFTSGANNGLTFQIDHWDSATGIFTLRFPTPYLAVAGDTYSATRGCQKRLQEDCITKFDNAVNHRGFDAPGMENITRLPLS